MRICGHGVREHIRLLAPLMGLLVVVWVLRLLSDALGAPHTVVRLFSMTVASALCVLAAAVMIHLKRFGSYPNVVAASLLLVVWEQLLISAAIAFAAITRTNNIFTAPEYSMPWAAHSHWIHIAGQLTFGIGLFTLYGSAMGCLFLWILRMMLPPSAQNGKARPGHYAVTR
ncbi:MAG TPA: hypothetical protein VLZ81_11005 [Blastocatellia bacterium]|nr:hypothetical protein [Blastocatellia bacterium]